MAQLLDVGAIASRVLEALEPEFAPMDCEREAGAEPTACLSDPPDIEDLSVRIRNLQREVDRLRATQGHLMQEIAEIEQQMWLLPAHILRLENWSVQVEARLGSLGLEIPKPGQPAGRDEELERYCTVKEIALQLGLGESTIRRYIRQRKLNAVHLPGGRGIRVAWSEVLAKLSILLILLLICSACAFPVQVQIATERPAATGELPATEGNETGDRALTGNETPSHARHVRAAGAAVRTRPAPTATPAGPEVSRATFPPTQLVAPAIGLDVPVVEIGWQVNAATGLPEWQTPENAAGFHRGSALPGWPSNTVISGHHNTNGKVFARLSELRRGDQITLYAGELSFRYAVEDIFIVPERGVPEEQRRQNASWIAPTRDTRVTLVSCWPANDNSHRVIVIARPLAAG